MPTKSPAALVSTEWLATHLGAPDLVVFDASWHLPASGRDAKAEYRAGHIPNALYFDIDDLTDERSTLPHMLPSTIKFASRMKKMGVGDGMRVVIYDQSDLHSAARAWWTFRVMGHNDVVVLDGGLKKWRTEGRPIDDGPAPRRSERHYTPRLNAELVRDMDDVKGVVATKAVQIVDARGAARFEGREIEPRPNLRAGHIPGARNVPQASLYRPDGTMKSPDEITDLFKASGIDTSRAVIATCGSGITACVLALGLAVAGRPNAAVYDGSFAEWGEAGGPAIETGPASP